MIVAKAEGNPFFTEELARAVAEGGSPTPGSAVPDTVEGVLMARIDRLAADDKRVLQAAAVIGRNLPFLCSGVLDPADGLLRGRPQLPERRVLYETRAASGSVHVQHALTHEVAYASLLPAQRRSLHARIVDVLEAGSARAARSSWSGSPPRPGRAWERPSTTRGARGAGSDTVGAPVPRQFDQAIAALDRARADRCWSRRSTCSSICATPCGPSPSSAGSSTVSSAQTTGRVEARQSGATGDDVRPPHAHVLDARGSGPGHRVRAARAGPRRGAGGHHGAGGGEPVPVDGVPHARQLPAGHEVRAEEHDTAPGRRAPRALRPARSPRRACHLAARALALEPRRAGRVRGSQRSGGEPAHRRTINHPWSQTFWPSERASQLRQGVCRRRRPPSSGASGSAGSGSSWRCST